MSTKAIISVSATCIVGLLLVLCLQGRERKTTYDRQADIDYRVRDLNNRLGYTTR